MVRAYIRNQEMADKQLDQLPMKLASSCSPNSGPRILYNRLWRFPYKPPALLGVMAQAHSQDRANERARPG